MDNLPADLSEAGRAEIFDALADAAAAIEENNRSPSASTCDAAEAHRRAGEMTKAIVSSTGILGIWRRDARPVSERVELGSRLLAELEGLPEDPEVHDARATVEMRACPRRTPRRTRWPRRAPPSIWPERRRLASGDPEMIVGVEWYDCYVAVHRGETGTAA